MKNISFETSIRRAAILFGIFSGGCGTVNDKAPVDIKKPNIIYILGGLLRKKVWRRRTL
jgi:hypothetical protein